MDHPGSWRAVLVKKTGPCDFVWSLDYCRLNALTRKDVFPMPRIDDLLDQLAGKTVFSTLDAPKGYLQVCMGVDSQKKTALVTVNGLYEF